MLSALSRKHGHCGTRSIRHMQLAFRIEFRLRSYKWQQLISCDADDIVTPLHATKTHSEAGVQPDLTTAQVARRSRRRWRSQ